MISLRKMVVVTWLLLGGLVFFGLLPKALAERISRALLFVMIVGFAVRVGAYLLQPGI